MRYWPPRNQPADAPWKNANPSTGDQGSVIDARGIEHPQREIVAAIKRLGLTPREDELDQLGRAIENAIAAATGGGETGTFATLPMLRANLRFYPETNTATGQLSISAPADGTIFVAPVGSVSHRSVHDHVISDIAEALRTFVTLPSKVYHLRQDLGTGALSLKDLGDGTYNPSSSPEANSAFDSSYDDALHARIVTNSSNVATITPLVNRNRLVDHEEITFFEGSGEGDNNASFSGGKTFNWARTPHVFSAVTTRQNSGAMPDNDVSRVSRTLTRYSIHETWLADYVSLLRVSYMLVAP
jgi:hypothetical protein